MGRNRVYGTFLFLVRRIVLLFPMTCVGQGLLLPKLFS